MSMNKFRAPQGFACGFALIAFAMAAGMSRASDAEAFPVLKPDVWIREIEGGDTKFTKFSGVNSRPDGDLLFQTFIEPGPYEPDRASVIAFFSGQSATWIEDRDTAPPLVESSKRLDDVFVGNRKAHQLEINGTAITFHSPAMDFDDDRAVLKRYNGWTTGCEDPGAAYIEVRSGQKVEKKVLVYLLPRPVAVPDDICESEDETKLFVPSYDKVRLVIPLLTGVTLSDGTIVVAGSSNQMAMPAIIRLRSDLTSPAIDNKTVFLIDKEKIDRARSKAVDEYEKICEGADCSEFPKLAHLIEAKIIALLHESENKP